MRLGKLLQARLNLWFKSEKAGGAVIQVPKTTVIFLSVCTGGREEKVTTQHMDEKGGIGESIVVDADNFVRSSVCWREFALILFLIGATKFGIRQYFELSKWAPLWAPASGETKVRTQKKKIVDIYKEILRQFIGGSFFIFLKKYLSVRRSIAFLTHFFIVFFLPNNLLGGNRTLLHTVYIYTRHGRMNVHRLS